MHPILHNRKHLAVYLAVWGILTGLLGTLPVWTGDLGWKEAMVLFLPPGIVLGFMSLGSWYTVRISPVGKIGWWRLTCTLMVSTLVICGIWILLGNGWVRMISQLPGWSGILVRFQRMFPFFWGMGVLLYGLAVAWHYLFLFFENSKAAEHRALASQILARESELKALKAQIHPHFLFNSLNSISALTSSDPQASREMCLLLADFLRKSLRYAGEQTVPLEEELDLAEKYLAIEKVRFGQRLRYECKVEENGLRVPILPLLLQPLVENAVNHGISQLLEGGLIRLEARIAGARLRIVMENPCDPEHRSPSRQGFGLSLVRRRLEEYYGEEAQLITENREGWFRIGISYPAPAILP